MCQSVGSLRSRRRHRLPLEMADDVQAGQNTEQYTEVSSDDYDILQAAVVGSASRVSCKETATATAQEAPSLKAALDGFRQAGQRVEDAIDNGDFTSEKEAAVVAVLVQTSAFLDNEMGKIEGVTGGKKRKRHDKQVVGTSVYVVGAPADKPTEPPTEAAKAKERIKNELPHGTFKKIHDLYKNQVELDVDGIVNGLKLDYKANNKHDGMEKLKETGMKTCIEVYVNAIHNKPQRRKRENTKQDVVGGAMQERDKTKQDVVKGAVRNVVGGAEMLDPNVCPPGSSTDTGED